MKKIFIIVEIHRGVNESCVCKLFNKRYDELGEVFFYSQDKRPIKEKICKAVNEYFFESESVCEIAHIHKITQKLYHAII